LWFAIISICGRLIGYLYLTTTYEQLSKITTDWFYHSNGHPALPGLLRRRAAVRRQRQPVTITPNADGITDVTRFNYRLTRSANLSIYLIDQPASATIFETSAAAPRARTRWILAAWSRAMLPNGVYTWVVEAVADGQNPRQPARYAHSGNADTQKPELQGFSVFPPGVYAQPGRH